MRGDGLIHEESQCGEIHALMWALSKRRKWSLLLRKRFLVGKGYLMKEEEERSWSWS